MGLVFLKTRRVVEGTERKRRERREVRVGRRGERSANSTRLLCVSLSHAACSFSIFDDTRSFPIMTYDFS